MASAGGTLFARVALDVPGVYGFDYGVAPALAKRVEPGAWVLVPWGRGRRIGIVTEVLDSTEVPPDRLREVIDVPADAAPLPRHWLDFAGFAARYYHRTLGEVILPALPKLLRTPPAPKARGSVFARARRRGAATGSAQTSEPALTSTEMAAAGAPVVKPTDAQANALAALGEAPGFGVYLLHGVTGSGKTEVYLRWLERVLAGRPDAQALLLVPEIALTPQLVGQLAARFGASEVAALHSELPDGERAAAWLAAVEGRVRLVVGTRLAVLTPLPGLAAIVVDEEHDASYKQQEGVRYSARDLAIALAHQRGVPIVLGSATPSLETWLGARRGRYRLLALPQRTGGAALPRLRVADIRTRKLEHGLAPETVAALRETLARGEQVLVFMNRRGYAPVLCCEACGWLSRCEACSACRVLHRRGAGMGVGAERGTGAAAGAEASRAPGSAGRTPASRYHLVCHHCGADGPVPRACPDCGNVDLRPTGRGTQRLEEGLRELFPEARIARVDRDVARRRGAARDAIEAAHAGEVDILVGTQMLAKGHDFRRLSLVVAVDADGGLYSSDFRAPERLFAVLMQVAGRAGRGAAAGDVIVQTRFPGHPLFDALARHDYAGFADAQLAERRAARLPPFMHQALLRAEGRSLDVALAFLAQAKALAAPLLAGEAAADAAADAGTRAGAAPAVRVYDPVPMPMVRLAGRERAQLLVECESRPALHAFLGAWLSGLHDVRSPAHWQLDVDPLEI